MNKRAGCWRSWTSQRVRHCLSVSTETSDERMNEELERALLSKHVRRNKQREAQLHEEARAQLHEPASASARAVV